MEFKSTTFNSFEKGSKLFFPSLFTVCLSLAPFYVKTKPLNVKKIMLKMSDRVPSERALVG